MIAVDTDILVYAHRRDSPFHEQAVAAIRGLAESPATWAIPWPCVHEFFAIATHARIYDPPSSPAEAIAQVEAWLGSPSLVFLHEGPTYWPTLCVMINSGKVDGPLVHEARIVALCRANGVRELWSADRDFARFPDVMVRNPLVANEPTR